MKLTIAIPTYNNQNTIAKAIDSAISQNFKKEYEILVVNNCSTDNTANILESYLPKIRIIKNHKTVSLFENHNICLENALGDYIVFCHSDDELLPDALTKYYGALKNRNFPLKYVVWGRSMFRDFYISWKNGGLSLNQISSGIEAIETFKIGGITPSGTCYSRKSFLEAGGFIKVNHRMAPSDLITMWNLIFYSFEFEMVDRIFFKREYASTANFTGSKSEYDSVLDAIQCFKSYVSEASFQLVVDKMFILNRLTSLTILKILVDEKIFSKNQLRLKVIKFFIKNPFSIFQLEYLKLLV
jgi:glycosyltransferase involved in cell wall biosynthesis